MNNLRINLLRKLGAGIGLVALLAGPTLAQQAQARLKSPPTNVVVVGRADIVAPTVQVQLSPSKIAVNEGPGPKTMSRPFDIVDPKTGKPIPPETVLTLPGGQTMTARQYWARMDKIEE